MALMPFDIDELPIKSGDKSQTAIVITPKKPMVIGHDRIRRLERSTSLNDVDRWLLDQAARRSQRAKVILFRALSPSGERVWQFDASLSDEELERGGYVLTCALLPFHRRLLARGLALMVHTDWGLRECHAMRHGTRRLKSELKQMAGENDAVATADAWVLGNMLLHVALSMDHVVSDLLPSHLSMIERRMPILKRMVSLLPADAID